MSKDKSVKNKKFAKWLDFLQQESWQLELIISSILLLILGSSDDYISELVNKTGDSVVGVFVSLLMPILIFIKTNLVIHIFFRGLWIGCIGLRYVSEDIDFEELSYTVKFNQFLKTRVNSFDNYIEKLERISSIIFSYSFLMIFHFISFWLFILFVVLLKYLFTDIIGIPNSVSNIFILFVFFTGFLNLIDFLTLGSLKKYKWTAFIFYPFYRVYNLITLSFLYRPLHYNFIDNLLGRRYMLFMIPYMLLLIIFTEGVSIGSYNYMPSKKLNSNWVIENYYDNLRKDKRIEKATINKLIYKDEPLKLFIRYKDISGTEKCLEQLCLNIAPYERNEFELNAFKEFKTAYDIAAIERKTKRERDSIKAVTKKLADSTINCISQLYNISIDTMSFTTKEFVFYQHPNLGEKGLLTILDISSLSKGKHSLNIEIKTDYKDNEFIIQTIEIPFFKDGLALNHHIE